MSASLNIVGNSVSDPTGASASGTGTMAGFAVGDGVEAGFETLLTVLLGLFAAGGVSSGGNATSAGLPETGIAAGSDGQAVQADAVASGSGGLADLSALFDLLARLAVEKGSVSGDGEGTETTSVERTVTDDTPDPLAAVLDLVIGVLENTASVANADAEGEAVTLDAGSGEAIKALNRILSGLTGQQPATAQTPAALAPGLVDRLGTLDRLLNDGIDDPQLVEIKTRIAALIGSGSGDTAKTMAADETTTPGSAAIAVSGSNETGKPNTATRADSASGDHAGTSAARTTTGPQPAALIDSASGTGADKSAIGDTTRANASVLSDTASGNDVNRTISGETTKPVVAAISEQTVTTDKSATGVLRGIPAQMPNGAGTAAQTADTQSGTGNGDASGQNQAQNGSLMQQSRLDSTLRQTPVASEFAVELVAEGSKTAKTADPAAELVATLPAQGIAPMSSTSSHILPAAYTQAQNAVDIPQIAFEIARHASDGVSRFHIRLDPPELGRIEVRLDLDQSGGLQARLTVDRPETYDMLQRDARVLERALIQTGLDQNKTNLEFSLRQNPFAHQDFSDGRNRNQDMTGWLNETSEAQTETPVTAVSPVALYRGIVHPGSVNLVA